MNKKNEDPGRKHQKKASVRKRKLNAKEEINKVENKAGEYIADKKKIGYLLNQAFEKAEKNQNLLGKILDDLIVLVRLVKAWVTGKYSKTPWQTLILVVATILYFVNPFDVIPDFIPVIGYVDDATMIATGIQSIRGDLKDFTRWERS